MSLQHSLNPQTLQYYATAPYDCSYLPGQMARSQVAAPADIINGATYSMLVQQGFRRSGGFVYRPMCDRCQACHSIRLPVAEFVPTRSQKRAAAQHRTLQVRWSRPFFSAEHFGLYTRYQAAKHAGGGMDQDDAGQYADFLVKSHVNTLMVEFREVSPEHTSGVLKMVSIIDQLQDGLSAVYTFYDPTPGQSLGTYNVLWQVAHAKALGLPYLYLGYWIEDSPKMAYKARFKPAEVLSQGRWIKR
jgi:arginyl-tRNA--protein-N-Asp/Glu arginylyltransferase